MITIQADITNPAHFFGSCGLFELAAYICPEVEACWVRNGFRINAEETVFSKIMKTIGGMKVLADGDESNSPFELIDQDSGVSLRMDWWEARNGQDRSRWKCFSGQMSASKTTDQLLGSCKRGYGEVTPETIFSYSERLSSRLNFDPRSAWDAGDAGFSPNNHSSLQEAITYPFTELLASIALQTFPFDEEKAREGTYHSWQIPLPLLTARLAASGKLPVIPSQQYRFPIENRSKNLTFLAFSSEDNNIQERKYR